LPIALDTNILCYALDPLYPEHSKLRDLLLNLSQDFTVAVNPTVIHETYHTLVFRQKWLPEDAGKRLTMLMKHPFVEFYNQTKTVSLIGLRLAESHRLGGRDALVIANYIANKTPTLYTHDADLLELGEITWKGFKMMIMDPLTKL